MTNRTQGDPDIPCSWQHQFRNILYGYTIIRIPQPQVTQYGRTGEFQLMSIHP